jgi:hypothetical protein
MSQRHILLLYRINLDKVWNLVKVYAGWGIIHLTPPGSPGALYPPTGTSLVL